MKAWIIKFHYSAVDTTSRRLADAQTRWSCIGMQINLLVKGGRIWNALVPLKGDTRANAPGSVCRNIQTIKVARERAQPPRPTTAPTGIYHLTTAMTEPLTWSNCLSFLLLIHASRPSPQRLMADAALCLGIRGQDSFLCLRSYSIAYRYQPSPLSR